ncbi:hypothetical protein RAS1_42080 [Phycisphaerae bacterium RAS1]|nr:hypothetical protein RAS1_42080 [Phycisphaerae bacterium RAS1]
MTTAKNNAKTTILTPGTLVVNTSDGEPGHIEQVGTFRRNGIHAWTYLVRTADGLETWDACDLFVPEQA